MITIPTAQEIQQNIIDNYEAELGQTVPLFQKSFLRILAKILGGLLYLAYRHSFWVVKQFFAKTADEVRLRILGEDYNITQIGGTFFRCTIVLNGTNGTVVQAGRAFTSGALVLLTETAETVAGGTVTLTLKSTIVGTAGNLLVGDSVSIVTQIAGLDSESTIDTILQNGEDLEDLEIFRDRIRDARRTPPQGGATPDWVKSAREVPGVVRAFAFRTAPGEVTVYPLTGFNADDRLPDSPKIAEVLAYVSDPIRRPLNCENVVVDSMSVKLFDVTMSSLVPNETELKETIKTAVRQYLIDRAPRQYLVQPNAKDVISVSDIYGIASQAGAQSLLVQLDEVGGASNITNYQLDYFELAEGDDVEFV